MPGANSVVYGSGSIVGTILIKDNIEQGNRNWSQDPKMVSVAPKNGSNILQWKLTQDSVRNDNTEKICTQIEMQS